MLVLALAFLAGVLLPQPFPELPPAWLILTVLTLMPFLFRWGYWRISAFLLGFIWAIWVGQSELAKRLPERLAGNDISLSGTVVSLPEIDKKHVRFNFKVSPAVADVPESIRLTWYHPDQAIKAGQRWRFTVRLKPPHGNLNPGGFDYERWLFANGIGATGYIRQTTLLAPPQPFTALAWRQTIADKIDGLSLAPVQLAMIRALTIGDGSGITAAQWEVFRKTGTTHLMVISGSHVALIAGFAFLLMLKLWARMPFHFLSPPQAASLAGILAALAYAALTGFGIPAQRAVVMLAVSMLALLRQRQLPVFHALGFALLAVLIVDPLAVLSPGFWLSFASVTLIVYAVTARLKAPGWLFAMVKVNTYTALGLAPLLLCFFQQVSLIAPLANLIAVPFIGFIIVPAGLLAVGVLLISPDAAFPIFWILQISLQGIWRLLAWLADVPHAVFTQLQPSWAALVLAVCGVVILLAPRGMPTRWLGAVLLAPLLITRHQPLATGEAKLTLLDVGQGLSVVIETAGHVLVYDTGAKFSEHSDAGQSIAIPYLRSQGYERISLLMVSHGDNDHIGGAESILAGMGADRILTSVPEMLDNFKPERCAAGQSWEWDGVRFNVLSPKPGHFLSDNDNSCVLQVKSSDSTFLLTGDIESEAENQLVQNFGGRLRADVLVAPHHGSRTSSTPPFLAAITPRVILVPAGYHNAFGHPHPDILERYRERQIPWRVSFEQGAITVNPGATGFNIQSWRNSQGHYWNYRLLENKDCFFWNDC
jgi:competence protein ComEC